MFRHLKRTALVSLIIFVMAALLSSCMSVGEHWEKARRQDTISSYETFLQKYPDSTYAEDARSRLSARVAQRDWNSACKENSINAYQTFLKQHAESEYAPEAKARLQKLTVQRQEAVDWKKASSTGTVEAYASFLENYPHGGRVKEARARLDDARFARLRSAPSLKAVEAYFREDASPRHAGEAMALVKTLVEKDPRLARVKTSVGKSSPKKGGKIAHCVWVLETTKASYIAYRGSNGQTRLMDGDGAPLEGKSAAEPIFGQFHNEMTAVFLFNRRDVPDNDKLVKKFMATTVKTLRKEFKENESDVGIILYRAIAPLPATSRTKRLTTLVCEWITTFDELKTQIIEGEVESRILAISCMGWLCDIRGNPLLVKALSDKDPGIRKAAATSILIIHDPDSYITLSGGGSEVLEALFEFWKQEDAYYPGSSFSKDISPLVRTFGAGAAPYLVDLLAAGVSEKTGAAVTGLLKERNPDEIVGYVEPKLLLPKEGPLVAKSLTAKYVEKSSSDRLKLRYWVATEDASRINRNWSALGPLLLADAREMVKQGRPRSVFRMSIRLGHDETVPVLKELIAECTVRSDIELFMNCGNPELEGAACAWAAKHELECSTMKAGSGPGVKWKSR